ncbi:MAG: S8 family serine peptidase [Actinomycetota bacterium]
MMLAVSCLSCASYVHATPAAADRSGTVRLEVLTANPADTSEVATAAQQLGGTVTGEVPGSVVQVTIAASKVSALASARGVRQVQVPQRAGYVPTDRPRRIEAAPRLGTGSSVGDEVAATQATAWHRASKTGAGVKVGVIDYFDIPGHWNPVEEGPTPTRANGHVFCQDSLVHPPGESSDCTSAAGTPGDLRPGSPAGDHGVAVVEILKDMAPGADVYVASVGTVSDMKAAVDWFVANGVRIITRSLGSPYDGPGDGTGPHDAVVNYAAAKGVLWFNSAGNDAVDAYMRRTVPTTLATNGYVNFNDGRASVGTAADTWLRLDGPYVWLDGIRWSTDWYLPPGRRTDYRIEYYETRADPSVNGDHWNPSLSDVWNPATGRAGEPILVDDLKQTGGASPLESADRYLTPHNQFGNFGGIVYMRIKLLNTVGTTPDRLEIAIAGNTLLELNYSDSAGSAAKPVVDSKNPSLIAVGAVDPPLGTHLGPYSSRGPTTDGRIKPDITAPSGMYSTVYKGTFSGTSAAAPSAAGAAALLAGEGLGTGAGLAALVRHFIIDRGTPGPDNNYGLGEVHLPPPASAAAPPGLGRFVSAGGANPHPMRLLDTRIGTIRGPHPMNAVLDIPVVGTTAVPMPTAGAHITAVAISLVSVGATVAGPIQAFPYLRGATGAFATLRVPTAGATTASFAIVPIGAAGRISLLVQTGGYVVVDVLGWFDDHNATLTNDGRYVPLATPERWLDTGLATKLVPGAVTRVEVPALSNVPSTGVEALVLHVTADHATAPGYLRVVPDSSVATGTSTVNFAIDQANGNDTIIAVGPHGTVDITASATVRGIVDVVGYITSDATTPQGALFVPVAQFRRYHSATPPNTSFLTGETRTITLTGAAVPLEATAVSAVFTMVTPSTPGYLRDWFGAIEPSTSMLNHVAGATVAGGTLAGLDAGQLHVKSTAAGNVFIDINGFFETPPI